MRKEKGWGWQLWDLWEADVLLLQASSRKYSPVMLKSTPELALRFLLANRNVSVALSGMENMEMVKENARAASLSEPLTKEELQVIQNFIEERKKKEEIPCTMCGYCQPCPNDITIPEIFQLMNYYSVYGLKEYASKRYQNIGPGDEDKIKQADACTECGRCEEQCPQKIKIIAKLKEIHAVLR